MGMAAVMSQASRTRLPTPSPSFPITMPIGPVSFRSYIHVPPISAQTNQSPFFFRSSMAAVRFVTLATGVWFSAPAEVLATTAVSPAALRFGMMTPWAPARLAVRMIAPRL